MKRFLALVLVFTLVLCGCGGAKNALGYHSVIKYPDMEYVRPELDEADAACRAAIDAAETAGSADAVMEAVWDYYAVYNDYTTNYNLAYIGSHRDLSDLYWQNEQEFCAQNAARMDEYLEDIYCALAQCRFREELEEEYFGEDYFDYYEDGGFYDETLVGLMEQEQSLISEYYDAMDDASAQELAGLLVQLIQVRQQQADWCGYDSYPEFAWDFYYYRDYTPDQADAYLTQIQTELVELYRSLDDGDIWEPYWQRCPEKEVFAYVEAAARNMGGVTEEAFELMKAGKLYDISPSETKSGLSFELYLNDYYEPYVFLSGMGTAYDCLTFAHEFGHFATDYAAAGSVAGIDVLEVFSQGMEYLSLSCTDADESFVRMKLADSLCVYVEQSAYARFEQQMYSLTGEDLTAENLMELYEDIGSSYGFDSAGWDPWEFVTIQHFYANPLYVISYVVSNDAAMQLYQMELQEPGAGKRCFEENLSTEEVYFLAFLDSAGLQSPFSRIQDVKALMQQHFGR